MAIFYFYLTTIDGYHGSDGRISNRIRTQHRVTKCITELQGCMIHLILLVKLQPITLHNLTLEEDTTYYIRVSGIKNLERAQVITLKIHRFGNMNVCVQTLRASHL